MIKKEFVCVECGKEYRRESEFKKHKILCKSINENDIENNKELTYTEWNHPEELRDLLKEIIKMINILKRDVDGLKKNLQIKKKKINILDWLQENKKCNISYNDLFNGIQITREHLKLVFRTDIVETIREILEDLIKKERENNSDRIPIISFDIKENEIFVFTDEKKWKQLGMEEFNNLVKPIFKQIIQEFKNWQDENEEKLCLDDFSNLYLEYVKKVMGGNLSIDKQLKKVQKNLYNFIKINLQNTYLYEFK